MSHFLFPALTLTKYNIANKEIIVIGEAHTNDTNINMANVQYTWDFMTQKLQEGYNIDLELSPTFKPQYKHIMKHIQSINIRNILKNAEKLNKLNKVSGMDLRRTGDFFGIFGNDNIQSYFFNKDQKLNDVNMLQFLVVIDNIMVFTNKHFYNKMKDVLINLNKTILDDLFFYHKKIDGHTKAIRQVIKKDFQQSKKQTYTFADTFRVLIKAGYPHKFESIVDDYRNFVLLFSDVLTVLEILYHPNDKHVLLIGNSHALNMRNYFKNYISFPNNVSHPKLKDKDKKMLGNMIKGKDYQVYMKFFK